MDEQLSDEGAPEQPGIESEAPEGVEDPVAEGMDAPEPGGDERAFEPPTAEPSRAEASGAAPTFEELSQSMEGSEPAALALLYDLDLPVSIELGRTRLSVQDVLGLGRGSVVQLDRQAGEPVDVFVGDRRFAEGEVVIIGEQFGIRVTRIVSSGPLTAAVTTP